MGFGTGIYPDSPYVAVKVPVFSFEKLHGVDSMGIGFVLAPRINVAGRLKSARLSVELLPLVLAQGSPIFHSSCEGKLGIALE